MAFPSTFRFAPSPNGFLHLGHGFSALLNAELAAAQGGRFLLRLENIDAARCTRAYADAIEEDLAWLGLQWERPARRQSDHVADYRANLARLRERDLLYPCFCSRGEIARAVGDRPDWPRDPDGAPLYPGLCRTLPAEAVRRRIEAGEPHALRLDAEAAARRVGPLGWTEIDARGEARRVVAEPGLWGDMVLARKDIGLSYHVAVVTDDAAQGVTHVVRGRDLFHATSVHRLLQSLLGLPEPLYRHHALLRDEAGEKLAKSRFSTPIRRLRAEGTDPARLRGALLAQADAA